MFKKLLKAKTAAQQAIVTAAIGEGRAMTAEELAQFNALQTEITSLEASIEAEMKLEAQAKIDATPVTPPVVVVPQKNEGIKLFKNLGEQLQAVRNVATTGMR